MTRWAHYPGPHHVFTQLLSVPRFGILALASYVTLGWLPNQQNLLHLPICKMGRVTRVSVLHNCRGHLLEHHRLRKWNRLGSCMVALAATRHENTRLAELKGQLWGRGTWGGFCRLSVRLPISAQVTISLFVSSRPASGPVLTGQRLLGILSLSLSLSLTVCPSPAHALSLKINK